METLDLRGILAANLRRMIAADTRRGERPSVRAWAMGRKLDVRMIDRLAKGEHAVTLDKLGEIAEACRLQPWHLLLPDLEPDSKPDAPITADERALLRRLHSLLDK